MILCFDCLLARPKWLERYVLGWYLLLTYGAGAFILPEGSSALIAQAIFFAVVFPWIVWPVIAAVRPQRQPSVRLQDKQGSKCCSASSEAKIGAAR